MPCHAYSYAARDAFPIDCGFFSARQSSRVFISVGDSERPFTVSSRFRLFRSVRGAHGGAPEGRYRGGDTPDIGRDAGVRVPRAEAPARARGSVRVPRRLSRARDTPRSALDPVSAEDAIRASDANLGSVGLRCHRRAGADRPPRRRESRRYHGHVSAARLRPRPATATRPDRRANANDSRTRHDSVHTIFSPPPSARRSPSRPEPTAPARAFPAPRTR
jgi:hypothetical protein